MFQKVDNTSVRGIFIYEDFVPTACRIHNPLPFVVVILHFPNRDLCMIEIMIHMKFLPLSAVDNGLTPCSSWGHYYITLK